MPGNKLYILSTFFTLLCLALFLGDFFTYGTHPVGNNMVVVYLCLLSAYAADKEVGRWTKAKAAELTQRRGSWFVVTWALFYAAAYLAEHLQSGYKTPEGLAKVVISVVGVFFGSGLSKRYYNMLKGEGDAWGGEETKKAQEAQRIQDEDDLIEQELLHLLKANPQGLSAPALAKGTSLSSRGVRRHLASIIKRGIVESFGKARSTEYRLKRQK